jgi:hypothetical protein
MAKADGATTKLRKTITPSQVPTPEASKIRRVRRMWIPSSSAWILEEKALKLEPGREVEASEAEWPV